MNSHRNQIESNRSSSNIWMKNNHQKSLDLGVEKNLKLKSILHENTGGDYFSYSLNNHLKKSKGHEKRKL